MEESNSFVKNLKKKNKGSSCLTCRIGRADKEKSQEITKVTGKFSLALVFSNSVAHHFVLGLITTHLPCAFLYWPQ